MSNIIYVSRTGISDIGHGGIHRAYQVLHDINRAIGEGSTTIVSVPEWRENQSNWFRRLYWLGQETKVNYLRKAIFFENPFNLLSHSPFTTRYFVPGKFWADYTKMIGDAQKPLVCVLDDTRLVKAIPINKEHGIPTILCSQNLEALDLSIRDYKQKWWLYTTAVDFANELHVLAQLDERLVNSQVDAGLIGGMGLSVRYYPYRPVGTIQQRLEAIRLKRETTNQETGLFLLLGSANHSTTMESMIWLISQIKKYGLPSGINIVAAGRHTEKLLPTGEKISGLEFKGWLPQVDLDNLLIKAKGVLVAQRCGNGALVRLPELACAGLPVITSPHPTYASGWTPGMHVVEDNWTAWSDKIEILNRSKATITADVYNEWEEKQPRPLMEVLHRLFRMNESESGMKR